MIDVKPRRSAAPAMLPTLAMARPADALREAEGVLADREASVLERTYALQAIGIVHRDRGDVGPAIRKFRRAVGMASTAGVPDRQPDLLASLGTALAMAGRKREALEAFDHALADPAREQRAQVLVRRAGVRELFHDLEGAYADCSEAVALFTQVCDRTWEARARTNLGHVLLQLGRFAAADAELVRAEALASAAGQDFVVAAAIHNRADSAHRQGLLPLALELLYDASERYRRLGMVFSNAVRDIVVVQLAAGLTSDAADTADQLVEILDRDPASVGRRADGLIVAAKAHLDCHDPQRAVALARRAVRTNDRLGDLDGKCHARLVLLKAQASMGRVTKRHARAASALAVELTDRYGSERLDAQLLAGSLARRTGMPELAVRHLDAAAAYRHQGSALRRAAGWLAVAQRADLAGDRANLLRACEHGLTVLDTHALSLGATELKATATAHGVDLVRTAIGCVLEDGSGRDLLRWTERWRNTLHAEPRPEARHNPELVRELAKLRRLEHGVGSMPADRLEAQRRQVEERVRRLTHGQSGQTGAGTGRRHVLRVADLLDELGHDLTLVAILAAKGRFHPVVARHGRVRRFEAGDLASARREAEYARFALRGAAVSPASAAERLMAGAGPTLSNLQAAVLGPAVQAIGDGPVVLMPPPTLQSAPWAALPALCDRPVSVVPSATAWLRARAAEPPRQQKVALVAAPGLETSAAEVGKLAPRYSDPVVLDGERATSAAALAAFDGAWLAHVGAHGRFRGDNPMFSSLELADGPLTVYDLERLRRPPYRMLLTACESGVGAPTGADELLGLAGSLGALGTAGILASVVPVNDASTVDLSLVVHERLAAGDDLANAVLAARAGADSAVAQATAWSFLALGAA